MCKKSWLARLDSVYQENHHGMARLEFLVLLSASAVAVVSLYCACAALTSTWFLQPLRNLSYKHTHTHSTHTRTQTDYCML